MQYIKQLSALAHQQRLAVFRLLISAGQMGMCPSDIAAQLKLPTSSLSGYLATLEQSGLLIASREGRFIHYSIAVVQVRNLFAYLISDCCAGHPELCQLNDLSTSVNKDQAA